jgi:hypothetical protein
MSRKLLAFLLSELQTVRVICKNSACRGVIELPLSHLAAKLHDATCPLCHQPFIQLRKREDNPFALFGKAVEEPQHYAPERYELEFIIPDTSAD